MADKRALDPMPRDVDQALRARTLRAAYDARPVGQRTDYIMWINRAKKNDTRAQRIDQMCDELEAGNAFLSEKWRPQRPQ